MPILDSEERPWGSWHVLDEGAGYKVKRIHVQPGKRLSLQSHKLRAENWTVVQGTALAQVDDTVQLLKPGGMVVIPLGARHRLSNDGPEELIVVEVQRGPSTAEDDITRYQDDFGRG